MFQGHGAVEVPLFSRMGGHKVHGNKQMLSVKTETSIFLSDSRSWGPQSEQRCPGSSGRIPRCSPVVTPAGPGSFLGSRTVVSDL